MNAPDNTQHRLAHQQLFQRSQWTVQWVSEVRPDPGNLQYAELQQNVSAVMATDVVNALEQFFALADFTRHSYVKVDKVLNTGILETAVLTAATAASGPRLVQ